MAVFSCLLTKLIWLFDKLIQKLFLHPYHENDTCHGNDKPNLEYLLGSALVICYHKSPKFFNILNTCISVIILQFKQIGLNQRNTSK